MLPPYIWFGDTTTMTGGQAVSLRGTLPAMNCGSA